MIKIYCRGILAGNLSQTYFIRDLYSRFARHPLRNLLPFQKNNQGVDKHNGEWLVFVYKDYVMDISHVMNKR